MHHADAETPTVAEVKSMTAEISDRVGTVLADMEAEAFPAVLALAQIIGSVAIGTGNEEIASSILRHVATNLETILEMRLKGKTILN